MSLLNTLNAQFKVRVLPLMPASIRASLEGGSKKSLLDQIKQRLLVVNNEIVNLDTGRSARVGADITANPEYPVAEIARAASSLVDSEAVGGIMLYLPPNDFVSTTVNMPGVSKDKLVSALKLQADNLFPGFDRTLDLTLSYQPADPDSNSIALWFTEETTNSLFDAFRAEGLFLVAVAPRNLLDLDQTAVVDLDAQGGTLVELSEGVVSSWLHINQLDLNDDKLNRQWLEAVETHSKDSVLVLDGMDSFKRIKSSAVPADYCFIPNGALQARKREEKGRNIGLAAAAVVVLLMFSAVPFIIQSFQFRSLAADLNSYRADSIEARENRSVVINFENDYGAITDFPVQDVQQAMFTLQAILQPDQLASFELSEGVIKIQGTSAEPQAILQRLEQDPLFTEVVFSRATNNSRYYIDLRLSTVNFEGYMVRHFPDA